MGLAFSCRCQQLYSIPKQTFDPFKVLVIRHNIGYHSIPSGIPKSMKLEMEEFEISSLITYAEYKEYLTEMKKDSSHKFYLSQLADTSMCLKETYKQYISGNAYDSYPVMGISWHAAMNYCKWKTIQNSKEGIKYIYRLPCESEWLDAYNYLSATSSKNDFSQNYSDWLLNSYDEDAMSFVDTLNRNHWYSFDYIYFTSKEEPNELKRKCVIGDSYLFKLETLSDYSELFYYSYQGYRQVGFRFIRESVDTTTIVTKYSKPKLGGDMGILKSWGLK